jgi:hypothetical protein
MRQWLLGVAVVLAAGGVAAADEKAEALVKKAIEAQGGVEALGKYPAARFTMKGEISIMGMDLELSGDMAYMPDKFRMNINMTVMGQQINVHQVVNGEKGKRSVKVGDNVMASTVEKDEIVLSRMGREVEKLTPLLDAKKFTIRTGDDEDVNGKKAALVIATPKGLDREFKLFFDKDSWLMVKSAHQGKGPGEGGAQVDVYQESFPSEYKKVNGVQVPTKLEIHNDGKKFMTATLSDYEVLEKLDDSEFKIDD